MRCPIAAPVPANNAKKARYVAELEPPSQYNHPYYDGPVEGACCRWLRCAYFVTHLVPRIRVQTHQLPGGTAACAWVNDDTCFIILPADELAPVDTYRRHETAHCNG